MGRVRLDRRENMKDSDGNARRDENDEGGSKGSG